jgi:hypothetical protein
VFQRGIDLDRRQRPLQVPLGCCDGVVAIVVVAVIVVVDVIVIAVIVVAI